MTEIDKALVPWQQLGSGDGWWFLTEPGSFKTHKAQWNVEALAQRLGISVDDKMTPLTPAAKDSSAYPPAWSEGPGTPSESDRMLGGTGMS